MFMCIVMCSYIDN